MSGAVKPATVRFYFDVALASEDARRTWDQLELVMSQWRAIERRLEEPGPFIYMATRTTLRPVDLG